MTVENREAALLAKAKEAEEQAEQVKDPKGRETWLKIAALYREMARKT